MRNSWKGLVVGGFTGAAVGIALDGFARGAHKAGEVTERARERAPDALDWARDVTDRASEWLRQADLPDKAKDLAQRIVESDTAAKAKTKASEAVTSVRDGAASVRHH